MHTNLGEFDKAKTYCEEARRIADETGKPFDASMSAIWYGHYLLTMGQPKEAIQALATSLNDIEEYNLDFFRTWANSWLGEAYALAGDLVRAESVLVSASDIAEQMGLRLSRIWSLARLSSVYLEMGEIRTGADYAEKALALSRESGCRWFEQISLRHFARARSLSGNSDTAEAVNQYRAAIELAEKLEARTELAHCRRELGNLYRRSERSLDATRELEAADELYRSLGMTFWVPETVSLLEEARAGQG
jgi:tetratricopeptide (TPR) repeat protein